MRTISLRTSRRSEMVDITAQVEREVSASGAEEGICVIFVPHTTAGITINENADPSVRADIQSVLSRLVPDGAGYNHLEGNADSHIKASLMGSSVCVPVRAAASGWGPGRESFSASSTVPAIARSGLKWYRSTLLEKAFYQKILNPNIEILNKFKIQMTQ